MKLTHRWVILLLCGMAVTQTVNSKTIPFKLVGNLIIIDAWVNKQHGNFVLDTGVPNLLLNDRYFKGKPSGNYLQGINGSIDEVEECYSQIRISEYQWERIHSEIVPMRVLEDAKGIPIHGLLGSDIFRDYLLFIDYQNQLIDLYLLDKKGNNVEEMPLFSPAVILPFQIKGGAPLISSWIGDRELRMTIDTGAEVNLLRAKHREALSWSWAGQSPRAYRIGGLGDRGKQLLLVEISDFRVADVFCPPMEMGFADLNQWNRSVYGPSADGILGYVFLQHFQIAMNFKKRELYLWDIDAPFDAVRVFQKK